ncbi:uncharacterized protein [Physcomitrium patens]|uniref:Uncharacterized protein n=1 Tax=Physcomitrium patens TaxID=3218 RepID=A0A2K1JLD3_PHYPA|nr:uncharacterized protein LOC112290571 [Physcomitrium patens]XP_024392729.1 uncharacterized protein LOC112290571 [Physcomitrium patens]XP_024392730.1 uncharacterized protein LOC112290571 [Physcomitrium patens]XP_024392731.1 uncharacterized protein LOC112290571 [Physcomitrium patens]PNR42362.1 hypothetical protein PHYPA_017191 [Physcomitrium patens]|eukprot:XP_024392728.1 uncharacterized protein LOC112290571 [Physcomitrella patens]
MVATNFSNTNLKAKQTCPMEMLDVSADLSRCPKSPVSSNDRKRSFLSVEDHEHKAKRRSADVSATGLSSSPTTLVSPNVRNTPLASTNGGVHTSSYSDAGYGPYASKINSIEKSSLPSYDTGLMDQGYPGHYDDIGRRNTEDFPSIPLCIPPPTKQNRFNLSRYQLGDDEDLFATISQPVAISEEDKPSRFKSQRERLMMARSQESEESGSTCPEFYETNLSLAAEGSSSQDSFMSQRERLRRFSNEQCRSVVIPNQWGGETKLQEFVAFGNIEDALRPLGLMMARAALVSDSVNTRHRHSSSSGRSYTSLSNPVTS